MIDFIEKIKMKFIILKIKKGVKNRISTICEEKFWIDIYGSYYINPKHIVVLIAVETDKMKEKLSTDKCLDLDLKNLFVKNNYPEEARKFALFYFESQETVDRESRGNWHSHLQ